MTNIEAKSNTTSRFSDVVQVRSERVNKKNTILVTFSRATYSTKITLK